MNAFSPRVVTLSGTVSSLIEVNANALSPITFVFSPKSTSVTVVKPANIEASISATPAPNVIVSSTMPLNASASTSVTLSGI